jgi:hypothetical protein
MFFFNKKILAISLQCLLCILLIACSNGDEQGFKDAVTANTKDITDIIVVSSNDRVRVGESEEYVAYGLVNDGETRIDISSSVRWSSSDSTVAVVNDQGVATGLANGSVEIVASLSDFSGSKTLRSSDATLISIAISNLPDDIPLCQTSRQKLVATGTYSDGDQAIISDKVSWVSSSDVVVYVGNADAESSERNAKGVLSGMSIGTAIVTASQDDVVSTGVEVSTVEGLNSISISSASESFYAASSLQFTAMGAYDSGSVDITANVEWVPTDDAIVTFSEDDIGLATFNESGSVGIGAVCAPGLEGELASDPSTIEVKEPVSIDSLRIEYDGNRYDDNDTITLDLEDSPIQLKLYTLDSADNQGTEDLSEEDETTWSPIGSPLSGDAPTISSEGVVSFDTLGESQFQVRYKEDDSDINVDISFFLKVE